MSVHAAGGTGRTIAEELLAMRQGFLSNCSTKTYNGYVVMPFRRLQRHHQTKGEIEVEARHASDSRLLLAGITALKRGMYRWMWGAQRDALLAIRHIVSWDDVNAWRLRLHSEFDRAFQNTNLPERPVTAQPMLRSEPAGA
ncbi:MAG: hypothetical protein R2867_09050 [Caldilineaceae bacterium]